MAQTRAGYASIHIVVATILGAVTGTVFGALFDPLIPGRRTLAVLAALAALIVDYLVRRIAASRFPDLLLDAKGPGTSPALLFVAAIMALAGGLATHDLGLVFNVLYGPVLGGFSGLFAGLMSAVLVLLRQDEHRAASQQAAPRRRSAASR